MIKALARDTGDGRPLYLFGLSEGNLHRLREGMPIRIDIGEMGGPWEGTVAIVYGRTEQDIAQSLRDLGLVDESTAVHGE